MSDDDSAMADYYADQQIERDVDALMAERALDPEQMWTCRDGSRIPIRQMSTTHLRNTVAMLERSCAARSLLTVATDYHVPDGCSDHVHDAVDAMASLASDHPLYAAMVAELTGRLATHAR